VENGTHTAAKAANKYGAKSNKNTAITQWRRRARKIYATSAMEPP